MIRIQIAIRLSSLLVRDVYARLIKSDGDDQHYLRVGRWLAPVIIFGSFAYVSFMGGGMLLYYLGLVGAFVVPLLTMYLMANSHAFTKILVRLALSLALYTVLLRCSRRMFSLRSWETVARRIFSVSSLPLEPW